MNYLKLVDDNSLQNTTFLQSARIKPIFTFYLLSGISLLGTYHQTYSCSIMFDATHANEFELIKCFREKNSKIMMINSMDKKCLLHE